MCMCACMPACVPVICLTKKGEIQILTYKNTNAISLLEQGRSGKERLAAQKRQHFPYRAMTLSIFFQNFPQYTLSSPWIIFN